MTNFADAILNHWKNNDWGYSSQLLEIKEEKNPAWAIKLHDHRVGVAIPYPSNEPISESFNNVRLHTETITNLYDGNVLALTSYDDTDAFALLCSDFINPGLDGNIRSKRIDDPIAWWQNWKKLLGNKDVDSKIYDVLGELICLTVLDNTGFSPIWTGPNGISTDIDCGSTKFEVKSTIARDSKTIEAHGLFQLAGDSVPKYLLYVQFEKSESGLSINKLVNHLVDRDFSLASLNHALDRLGHPVGASSRNACFRLLGISKYAIDNSFPHIGPSSFISGKLPDGVMSISYTVSLDGIDSENMMPSVPEING